MQTRLRQLLILLLSLWLPLQGLAGALSPRCAHHAGMAGAPAQHHAAMDHGAHHHHADTAHAQHAAAPQPGDDAHCDHCEPCHPGASFLPVPLLNAAALPPESFGAAATENNLPQVFIDGPHRPPRSTLA